MTYVSDEEYRRIKNKKICSQCGSINMKRLQNTNRYYDYENYVRYECQYCGNIGTYCN